MSNIKLNLKKNVAYIKIDNVLTKNSLDRNDLKRITDFLIKICNQNLIRNLMIRFHLKEKLST